MITRRRFFRSTPTLTAARLAPGALLLAVAAPASLAQFDDYAILQWFEVRWDTMEHRMPDFFKAGYGATWIPPVSKSDDKTSPGYDPFDRFNLGKPGVEPAPGVDSRLVTETMYGTEADFRAVVEQFHRANALVFPDIIMNHNGSRLAASDQWLIEGDWPGFHIVDNFNGNWLDFHDGGRQSENPCGFNYDLFEGDLVSLIDIDQDVDVWMVRQPADDALPQGWQSSPSDPWRRIPEGTLRDKPDPENRRFYPDLDLPTYDVTNPGWNRFASGSICGGGTLFPANSVGQFTETFGQFNPSDPTAGDPVPERPVDYLNRWTRWMLEDIGVDGFRLDAAKHIDQNYWDRYWDTAINLRWERPDGVMDTPFSFVEATSGNFDVYNQYVRKQVVTDGFGNVTWKADRDALDLSGSASIRNVIGGKGGAFAGDLDQQHIDTEDDGFNNGSLGVNHIYSHDNGSTGGGNSAPDFPFEDKIAPWAHAYLLLRTGRPIVYHHGREALTRRTSGFFPREGASTALGFGSKYVLPGPVLETDFDWRIPTLVQLRNRYARGDFFPRWQDGDVYIFERATDTTGGGAYKGNVIVGVNDNYTTGWDTRTIQTFFDPGTVLHELTGNATNPEVDPGGDIFDTVTVNGSGQVTIRVPRNGGSANEHNNGYVVYGPVTPSGTLTITDQWDVIPANSASTPTWARRLTTVPVVKGPTFDIQLNTTQTDPGDPNTDDNAIFRINQGFQDLNGNGLPVRNGAGEVTSTEIGGEFRAYEEFIDVNSPLFGGGSGTYEQTIDVADLPEGYNYISVVAFRNRPANYGALTNEWREVVYVDRLDPDIEIEGDLDCLTVSGFIRITNPDRTVSQVLASIDGAPPAATIERDRNLWLLPVSNLTGNHTVTVVAREIENGLLIREVTYNIPFTVDDIPGDVDDDGDVDTDDLYAFEALTSYTCRADLNADQAITAVDGELLRAKLGEGELSDMLSSR